VCRLSRPWLYKPELLLIGTFLLLILVGGAALLLPACQRAKVNALDAFFTAASAVCVTGLITVDTEKDYSRLGQTVILVLIQLGGLGIMTFSALVAATLGRRVSFTSHAAIQDVFFQRDVQRSLRVALVQIVLLTLTIEAVGAVLIYTGLRALPEPRDRPFDAIFLSVSAYCNAGFSVYSDNLMGVRSSGLLVTTIMLLITLGGLGYTVLIELGERLWRRLRPGRQGRLVWSLNSTVVLVTSALLTGGGAALLCLTGMTSRESGVLATVWHALFQSVTSRTAGFNTVDIAALPVPSLMVLIGLMFIGGSPGSCAGGIKTTSAAVWAARLWSHVTGRSEVVLARRRIPEDVVRRAAMVVALAAVWMGGGVMLLTITEGVGDGHRLEDLIFEQVSAFGTVGLSTGVTPELTPLGKLWIMASMFAGRVGPLTVALALIPRQGAPPFAYPRERVMIG
jgi:trk system potassium uptake protein TrkH